MFKISARVRQRISLKVMKRCERYSDGMFLSYISSFDSEVNSTLSQISDGTDPLNKLLLRAL